MLQDHYSKELKQKGKSDIYPEDYIEKTRKWYKQIFDFVEMNPPNDFVKSINIFQDSIQNIKNIEYNYLGNDPYRQYLSINIVWID